MRQLITIVKFFTILGFMASLTACGGDDVAQPVTSKAATTKATEAISIKQAYIRAMPPGQKVTALFMTLDNSSDHPHALVKAEGDVSESVELHEHKHENGMMKMGQVDHISVPENGSVALAPGGYHVMLIGLKRDLKLGEKIAINLVFADGSSQQIQPEVKTINPH